MLADKIQQQHTKGGKIRWRVAQHVFRQHSFGSAVLGACACSFQPDSPCMAVLEADRVTVYAQDGTVHSVALARRPRALWQLRNGIVIEPDKAALGREERLPLLTLTRALDEPQPIEASDALGTILLSDAPRSRLLVHDPWRRRHAIWAVLPVAPPASPPSAVIPPSAPSREPPVGGGPSMEMANVSDLTLLPAPEPAPGSRLALIWCQPDGAAGAAATHYFVTPPVSHAPALLFVLQPSDGHLYCYPLPQDRPVAAGDADDADDSAGGGGGLRVTTPSTASSPSAGSRREPLLVAAHDGAAPIASIPALSAQPVRTSLSPLVVASVIVLAPTGHLELYNCADDGTVRCMHRELPPPPHRRWRRWRRGRPLRLPRRRSLPPAPRRRTSARGNRRRSWWRIASECRAARRRRRRRRRRAAAGRRPVARWSW